MFDNSFLYQRPFWGGRDQRHGELIGNPFTITFVTSLEVPGGKQLHVTPDGVVGVQCATMKVITGNCKSTHCIKTGGQMVIKMVTIFANFVNPCFVSHPV
jgi:hypothetical protein